MFNKSSFIQLRLAYVYYIFIVATFHFLQISKDCELLLVKKRLDESRFSRYGAAASSRDKQVTKTPDAAKIKEATAKLPKRGTARKQRENLSLDEVYDQIPTSHDTFTPNVACV